MKNGSARGDAGLIALRIVVKLDHHPIFQRLCFWTQVAIQELAGIQAVRSKARAVRSRELGRWPPNSATEVRMEEQRVAALDAVAD